MLKMVDGTGIIGVDMICPLGVSTPQPPNYDKVELEGTGMLVLPNSLDAPLERLELGGKAEQVQTSGKQMLNEELLKSLSNYTSNGSGYYYYRISGLEVGKKYTVSRGDVKTGKNALLGISVNQESTNKAKFLVYDGLGTSYNNASITWEQTTGEYVDILFSVSGSVMSTTQEKLTEFWKRISYVQLEKGSTATAYEPYTGGKPSPSPEYPQKIKNAGKWNEETQKYEVDVKVTGKNLLNLQKEPDVKGTYQGWKVGNGELLTLGVKDKGNNADIKGCYIGFSDQGSESKGVVWVVDNGVIKTNPLNQRKAYVSIFPANETTVKKLTERFDIQCELGNVATPYQPYKEQTLTLTSDRPLTKWDRLVEQGGQIGWLYATKKHVVTGSEHFISGGVNYYTGSSVDLYFNVMDATGSQGIVKNLSDVPSIWHNKDAEGFRVNGSQFHIRLKNTRLSVSDDATKDEKIAAYKTYLVGEHEKGTPYEIVYQSLEPEFVPLPQSEQNAIRALKTYYPTTVITADGGEVDPDIKATYRKEI